MVPKSLNPSQGLKLSARAGARTCAGGSKISKPLSGIETMLFFPLIKLLRSIVPKSLNPSQGLKQGIFQGNYTDNLVPKSLNPSQGLKPLPTE